MRLRALLAALMILSLACGGFVGCSSDTPGTNAPLEKTLTAEQIKEQQKKLMEGMKGMYKGAPGAPVPKS
jgi:hypothetical protein